MGKTALNFKDLTTMNFLEVETFLKQSFLKKSKDRYFTCIINNKLGRGLDAPTNIKIEEKGGITVIIA